MILMITVFIWLFILIWFFLFLGCSVSQFFFKSISAFGFLSLYEVAICNSCFRLKLFQPINLLQIETFIGRNNLKNFLFPHEKIEKRKSRMWSNEELSLGVKHYKTFRRLKKLNKSQLDPKGFPWYLILTIYVLLSNKIFKLSKITICWKMILSIEVIWINMKYNVQLHKSHIKLPLKQK